MWHLSFMFFSPNRVLIVLAKHLWNRLRAALGFEKWTLIRWDSTVFSAGLADSCTAEPAACAPSYTIVMLNSELVLEPVDLLTPPQPHQRHPLDRAAYSQKNLSHWIKHDNELKDNSVCKQITVMMQSCIYPSLLRPKQSHLLIAAVFFLFQMEHCDKGVCESPLWSDPPLWVWT